MATDARVAMYARRGEDFVFLVRVRGPDLTVSALRMQVRERAGTPGPALLSLERVTDDSLGLRVVDTRTVDGVLETVIRILIPTASLALLPWSPVVGGPKSLAFGFMISGKSRLVGDLLVSDSAIDSDGAPLGRAPFAAGGAHMADGSVQQGLTLTIAQDQGMTIELDGADLLGPLATRAVDAIDTVEGIATTSYRAVATYGEREAIPLDKRAPGMLVRVLEGSTDGGRVFIWNPSFAMPGAWTGLLNEEEKMRLDLMHGGLGQDKIYGLTGSLDAIRDANAAVARVKVGSLRAELLAGGAATIAWTRDGARPDAQEVAWGDWSVPLSGDVERFDLRDWTMIDRLFVAGNSLSDTTGGNGQWSQLLAQQLGVPLVSVARGSSDARQVYKTGARPLLLTLSGQLPANGSAAVTLINGVAPSLDSYVSPASFLNSYGGDATPASLTGYVTDGTTSRRVTVSIARSDSTDYRITQAAGGSAVTFAGPVLFTPDTVIEPARSLNGLWLGNNYFYSGVPGAYGDNTNAQLWTDMAAIVRQWNGARGFILPILPATDWVARGPGTPYDAYIAANARTRSLYPRYWLTDAQGRDLVAYILQVGSDGSDSDKADIAKGFTPGSCRYDGLHLNAKGVGLVVAFLLAALPRQAMPPMLAEGMTVRLTASGAGTADSAIAKAVLPELTMLIDGIRTQAEFRSSLAAAVADFDVGTFFVSRDTDGVSLYPGVKRQYQRIAQAPFWADRGPFIDKGDIDLDRVENIAPTDMPVSRDQRAAIDQALLASTALTSFALDRRIRADQPQDYGDAGRAQARANLDVPPTGDLLAARGVADRALTTARLVLPSVIALTTSAIDADVATVHCSSYYGDGKELNSASRWRRAPVQAAGDGRRQSADGAWWLIDEPQIDPKMLGARSSDRTTISTSAVQEAVRVVTGDGSGHQAMGGSRKVVLTPPNAVVAFPALCGAYVVDREIVMTHGVSAEILSGAELLADASFVGEAVISSLDSAVWQAKNVSIRVDGVINADLHADWCIFPRTAQAWRVQGNGELNRGRLGGIRLGSATTTLRPFENVIGPLRINGPQVTTYMEARNGNDATSIGCWLSRCTDNFTDRLIVTGYRTGFQDDGANNNGFGHHIYSAGLTGRFMGPLTCGFRFNGQASEYFSLYTDTPTSMGNPGINDVYGFEFTPLATGVRVVGAKVLLNYDNLSDTTVFSTGICTAVQHTSNARDNRIDHLDCRSVDPSKIKFKTIFGGFAFAYLSRTGTQVQSGSAPALGDIVFDRPSSRTTQSPRKLRNLAHNGGFTIWQRGVGPFDAGAAGKRTFGPDRWFSIADSAATRSLSRASVTAGQAAAFSRLASPYALRASRSGAAGTGYWRIAQVHPLEVMFGLTTKLLSPRFAIRLAGGAFPSAQARFGIEQNFGSGGSASVFTEATFATGPSDVVAAYSAKAPSLSPPEITGKTIGAGAYIAFYISLPDTGTYDVEITDLTITDGPEAVISDLTDQDEELVRARRYYESVDVVTINGSQFVQALPKAGVPTVTASAGTLGTITKNGALLTDTQSRASTLTFVAAEP